MSDDSYTVEMAINDWLADRKGVAQSTIDTARSVTRPLIEVIGSKKIKRLVAADVLGALEDYAATRCDRGYARQGTGRAYSTVHRAHGHLVNAIRYAEAHDKVGRNVATLIDTPDGGNDGRESKAMPRELALAVLEGIKWTRMDAYIALGLTQGVRTEEERPLLWANVDDLDAEEAG